jgi:outer membrane protein OmpA-like peptidoglycan-associated protein
VNGQRLMVTGAGANHPIASNATDAGRAENRRVEITLVPIRS